MSTANSSGHADLTSLTAAVVHWKNTKPDHPALTYLEGQDEENITYSALHARALEIAGALVGNSEEGDRVILGYEQSLDYVCAFLACVYAGRVAVTSAPPTELRKSARLQKLISNSEATVILTHARAEDLFADVAGQVRVINTDVLETPALEAPFEADPGALMFLQYTSGSTSDPKGVMLTHASIAANLKAILADTKPDDDGVYVSWLPLYHDMGLIFMTLAPLFAGRPVYLMSPAEFLRHPERWLQAITKYKATLTAAPNFAYRLCCERIRPQMRAALDLSSMRYFINGSEPIHLEDMEAFRDAFADRGLDEGALMGGYGMAELGVYACLGPIFSQATDFDETALHTNGKVETPGARTTKVKRLAACGAHNSAHFDIQIVDPETSEACGEGASGEIWIAGASVGEGYWQNVPSTMLSFGGKLSGRAGTYLRTGDIGFRKNGQLYVCGRIKEMMILRGRNIFPADICAVVEDIGPAMRGRRAAAFVLPGGSEEELVIVCAARCANVGACEAVARRITSDVSRECGVIPNDIVFVQNRALSRTTSGKVQHAAVRKAYVEGTLEIDFSLRQSQGGAQSEVRIEDATAADVPDWVVDKVCDCFAQVSDGQRPSCDQDLFEFGLDSLQAVRLIEAIENQFLGRKSNLKLSDLAELRSPREIARSIVLPTEQQAPLREVVL